ncbi:MAG: carbohydrate binding family 9 domain-containing protein [Candidatus Latescibacteria bacterium]|nr:carbohydrate binding family 9 domain-containing protein [Candidatus Latescibacterota bacterium]
MNNGVLRYVSIFFPVFLIYSCASSYKTYAEEQDNVPIIRSEKTVSNRTSITAHRVESPIRLDGLSNEEAWEGSEPFPVVMQVPHFGAEPSERTEILIAYDDEYLYVAGRCFDSEPDAIHATTFKRDDNDESSDSFGISIDTFNDNENALAFITTPTGSRTDMTIFNDALGGINSTWNTFWDVAVKRTGEGWFVEMRIPFSSLRFQEKTGRVIMSFTAFRWIARKDERIVFPAIPEKWGSSSHMKPSKAQEFLFDGIHSHKPLYITPYALAGVGRSYDLNDTGTAYRHNEKTEHEAGIDVKYGLTSNLTLDVSVNTDFAQVEADDQQINLTRYSLFYPEKRLFFLERSSNFNYNFYGSSSLFYTRSIGIYNGRSVPIYGGARVVGRVGRWDVGLLNMQTGKIEDLPSENFAVLRLRRQVINPYSYFGGIITSRTGTDGTYNTAYGMDGIFRVFGDDYLKLNWAQTFDNDADNNPLSLEPSKVRAHWERYRYTGWAYGLNYSRSGAEYNPGMGFEQHPNATTIVHFLRYGFEPGKQSGFLLHIPYEDFFLYIRNSDNTLEYFKMRAGWVVTMKSGYNYSLNAVSNVEDLREPLSFSENAWVPKGSYTFYSINCDFSTPGGRLLRLDTSINAGNFYDGWRLSPEISASRNLSSHLELSGTYQLNRVEFPERNQQFTAHIGRLRVLAMLNVRYTLTAFIQYNSAADKVITNLRLRYNPREGNDLYLVYDEGLNTDRYREEPVLPVTGSRTVMLKYSYMFNL